MFVLLTSRASSKMRYVGSKIRSLEPCVRFRGHIFNAIIMKLGQDVCLDESRTSPKMVHAGSKTKLLGHILEKPCEHSRSHIFSQIIMNLGQNVCLVEISDELKNASCRSGQKLGH